MISNYSGYYGWRPKDEDLDDPQKNEWRKEAAKLNSDGNFVYVLSLELYEHGGEGPETNVVGLCDSKAAAVARSSTLECGKFGKFDEAIEEYADPEDHIDNRKNPPDDGVLLEIGGPGVGEGDYARLLIKKMEVLRLPDKKIGETVKRVSNEGGNKSRKKTRKEGTQRNVKTIEILDD